MGTARLLETVNNQTRSVGRAVRRPYSDSEESDNDVLYAEEHDSTEQQVSLRNDWLTQTANDSCGEGCAQLDDFNWFLPADERAGDLTAPESEDGAVAVDTRQVSAALDTVVSREVHRKSECVPIVVPTLAAVPQAASEVV